MRNRSFRPPRCSRLRDSRGSVLILTAVLMTAMLGMGALAIDMGSFYQQQKQAQAAADAGALAGARDLPTTSTATTDATTYATKNMSDANTPVVSATSSSIQVTVSKTVPTFLGKILGITSQNVSATAIAKLNSTSGCSNPGSTCWTIFAMDSTCPGTGTNGVNVTAGSVNITGGVLSNSNFTDSAGNGSFGSTYVGPTCSTSNAPHQTFPSPGTPVRETSVISNWPIDYRNDFPACSPAAACTGPSGTPSWCTQASTTATVTISPASGNIYCAVGTGTASTPSTWNGAISITSSSGTVFASFVGGTVSIATGGGTLAACGYSASGYQSSSCSASEPAPSTTNYPVFYATGSSSTAVSLTGGNLSLQGDIFAPNGGINVAAGSMSLQTFLEGNDVTLAAGALTGDGPTDTAGPTSLIGPASLTG